MSSATSFNSGMSASFLPEDYRQRKVEGRTGVLMVILFCIVMFGVVAAFYVTNREWAAVQSLQEQINVQYATEAKKTDQLKVLEAQKSEMVEKAEITTALIEKMKVIDRLIVVSDDRDGHVCAPERAAAAATPCAPAQGPSSS